MNLKEKTKAKHTSSKPRKTRKNLYTAPLHKLQKTMHCHLTKELRAKLKKRAIQVKKGDKVKITRGNYKNTTGKVLLVNLKKQYITIEGCKIKKQSGKETQAKIQPSNAIIIETTEKNI